MSLSDNIERLPFNDALVNETGHRIELIDPGFPHEPSYCVRYDKTNYFMSPTTRHDQVENVIDFLETFEWEALHLPKPEGEWRRVMCGASDNPLWDHPLSILMLPDYQLLQQRSEQTGALKTQMRIKRRRNHQADDPQGRHIQIVSSTCRRGEGITTEPQFAVNRCYTPVNKKNKRALSVVRIEAIREASLDEMTIEDLYSEGYSDWNAFYHYWRKNDGSLRLDIPVWCLHLAPVFTRPEEFKLSDFRPTFVFPSAPPPAPRQLAIAGF